MVSDLQFARRDWIVLAISLLVAATVPAFAFVSVPVWSDMLRDVPELVPASTRFLFAYYWLALLFPILIVGVWAKANKSSRAVLAIGISVLGAAVLLVTIWEVGTPADAILEVVRRA